MTIEVEIQGTGQIIEFPDGTTPEVIQNALASFRTQQAQQPVEQSPTKQPRRVATGRGIAGQRAQAQREEALSQLSPERRAFLESISPAEAALIGAGRGFVNIGRGIGLVDDSTPSEEQAFQELQAASPTATTLGQAVGEAAPFVPAAIATGGIAGLAPRVAATGVLGGLEGGIITAGRGGEAEDITQGAGIGAAVASGIELGLPIIGRLGGRIIRNVTGKSPTAPVLKPDGTPTPELARALDRSGITFDDLTADAQRLVQSGDVVEPEQAARKLFLEEQGITPTRAQVTGEASDFQSQQELFKVSGAVRRALEGQEDVLVNRFENAITGTGGSANRSNSTAFDYIADRSIDLDKSISDAYQAARAAAPTAQVVKPDNLVESIRSIAGSDNATGGLASATRDILIEKGLLGSKGLKIQGRVTPEVAESIRIDLNALHDSLTPFGKRKLADFKNSLDKDVQEAVGIDVFADARAAKSQFEKDLSRAKVNKFDKRRKNLVRDILENKVNPDRFLDEAVLSKSIRSDDVEQLKRFLLIDGDEAGTAAWNDVRAEALTRIRNDAFNEIGGQNFLTAKRLDSALDKFGRDKLRVLFTPEERKFLQDMKKVAQIREPKAGTALGRGPSAQAVQKLEEVVKRIPILGGVFEGIGTNAAGRLALRQPSITPLQPTQLAPVVAPAAVAGSLAAGEQ